MSDTPRTDARVELLRKCYTSHQRYEAMVEFAKTLERELACKAAPFSQPDCPGTLREVSGPDELAEIGREAAEKSLRIAFNLPLPSRLICRGIKKGKTE